MYKRQVQITFTGLDGEILLERLDVITIVSQFTGSLYEERSIGTVGGEISRFTDGKQMRENFIIRGCSSGYGADRSTPLPQSERIFQYRVIVNFFNRCTE